MNWDAITLKCPVKALEVDLAAVKCSQYLNYTIISTKTAKSGPKTDHVQPPLPTSVC